MICSVLSRWLTVCFTTGYHDSLSLHWLPWFAGICWLLALLLVIHQLNMVIHHEPKLVLCTVCRSQRRVPVARSLCGARASALGATGAWAHGAWRSALMVNGGGWMWTTSLLFGQLTWKLKMPFQWVNQLWWDFPRNRACQRERERVTIGINPPFGSL